MCTVPTRERSAYRVCTASRSPPVSRHLSSLVSAADQLKNGFSSVGGLAARGLGGPARPLRASRARCSAASFDLGLLSSTASADSARACVWSASGTAQPHSRRRSAIASSPAPRSISLRAHSVTLLAHASNSAAGRGRSAIASPSAQNAAQAVRLRTRALVPAVSSRSSSSASASSASARWPRLTGRAPTAICSSSNAEARSFALAAVLLPLRRSPASIFISLLSRERGKPA
mmetsp:Transcript_42357/g.136233  ORF Transcript_42357/g.136233 Transcript_42357/m.136233 type:complete len:232 (+) Transcript_42357:44-739(+)